MKKLVRLNASNMEAFQKNELQKAMTGLITGSGTGSSQTETRYDSCGNVVSCRKRFDTQVVDFQTRDTKTIWGDWIDC